MQEREHCLQEMSDAFLSYNSGKDRNLLFYTSVVTIEGFIVTLKYGSLF